MSKLRLLGYLLFSSLVGAICVISGVTMTKNIVAADTLGSTATNITLTANPTNVWLQSDSTLSGNLTTRDASTTPPGATPVTSEPVQIQMYVGNDAWNTVANTTTDTNGAFAAQVVITNASATYRAVFLGDSTYAASTSTSIQVTGFLASTKLYSTGPWRVKAETATTYTAHYAASDSRLSGNPPISGAQVDVYRRDVYGGRWYRMTTLTTDSNGNISWRATVSTPTDWHLVGHSTSRSYAANSNIYMPRVIPIGHVYVLPSSAPKPKYLTPQSAAVGSGAHPIVSRISNAIWNYMVGKSWHAGCPVGRSQLEYMTINYWGFDGYRHRGQMVFNASRRADFIAAFTRLYNSHIPLHGMYLVDRFGYSSVTHGANDYASMEHDNTSAFNCRWVDGQPGILSPHTYGTAVDINPYENPYDSAKGWTPNSWWRYHFINPYTWRSSSNTTVHDMLISGFSWTYGNADSQHFDAH